MEPKFNKYSFCIGVCTGFLFMAAIGYFFNPAVRLPEEFDLIIEPQDPHRDPCIEHMRRCVFKRYHDSNETARPAVVIEYEYKDFMDEFKYKK